MDHVINIFENDQRDLDAERWDHLMVEAELAYEAEMAMQEGMPEPVKVSGLGRPFPGTHPSPEAISRVSRSWSPGCDVSGIPF